MSAHGVPGALGSALSLLWRWLLIAAVLIIVFRLVTYFVPELNQPNLKKYISSENVDENGEVFKKKSMLDYFFPGAIKGNLFSAPETPAVKYIKAPSLEDYENASQKWEYQKYGEGQIYDYQTYDTSNPY
jgi:hypothetical protein